MGKVCFAILAHAKRACLEDMILNLRTFSPSCDVVVFNGGRDPHLTDGLDVEVCPYSERLKWSKLQQFQFGIMRWLHEEQRAFDFLVTLDGDMLLIKPGFERYLETTMADNAYMAVNFMETLPDTDWNVGETHHYHWRRIWQPIFGTRNPYQCFNPGQVFRKEYVDRFMAFPKREELIHRALRSHLPALEEMIFATLAMTLKCRPRSYPCSQIPPVRDLESQACAIRWVKRHSPREIQQHLANEDVFLLHPIPLDPAAPERRLVGALRAATKAAVTAAAVAGGLGALDFDSYQRAFDAESAAALSASFHPNGRTILKRRLRAIVGPVFWKLRKLYRRTVP